MKAASPSKIDELKETVKTFPETPGVYLMKSSQGKIIYVGKAKDLRARVRTYLNKVADQSVKTKYLVAQIHEIDFLLTLTEVEAYLLEASLIKKYKPRYNIRLKDDKSYPYIKCTWGEEFPRFYIARKVRDDGAYYFGPYTSSFAVRESIQFMNRTFKVRDCSDAFFKNRKRPCMTYQIGRCTAPCVDLVTQDEYKRDVNDALDFLRSRDKNFIKSLNEKMKAASDAERFEVAAKFRDSIDAVKRIWEKQSVVNTDADVDQDIVNFYGDERGTMLKMIHSRKGRVIGHRDHFLARLNVKDPSEDHREWLTSFLNQYYVDNVIPDEILLPVDLGNDLEKMLNEVFLSRQKKSVRFVSVVGKKQNQLLEIARKNAQEQFEKQMSQEEDTVKGLREIQERLSLPALPLRIECFDVSHFQGSETVGSQVVFENGDVKSDDYRRYKLRTVEGPDDFKSMHELLSRRLKHTEYDDPQLLLIDGGKGQLSSVVEVLKELGRPEIPVAGIAKARTQGEFSDREVKSSEERLFIPGRQNPVTFPRGSKGLKILTAIRDEAHRFAITYHRSLREKSSLASELDLVYGLGPAKKQALLKRYKDLSEIRKATVEELCEIKGFTKALAARILEQLNLS